MDPRISAPRVLAVLAISSIVTGCAVLGPAAIRSGRAAYNEAIVSTNNEQLLAMIVRMRYGEPSGLLAVSSVTANLHFQTSAGAEFGIGSDSSFEGNLTPLSAGIAYEENPTISYTPVQGEKYLRELLSPLPMDLTLLLLGAMGDSPQAMMLLCRSINGIQNPDFLPHATIDPDPRFARIAEIFGELHRDGHVTWAQERADSPSSVLALRGTGAAYAQQVGELHRLLGVPRPRSFDGVIVLPVYLGIGRPAGAAIELRTPSLYDLFGISAASVEVPPAHVQSGVAPPSPRAASGRYGIRIQGSKKRPRMALIAVKHHGWWYSIDARDSQSKITFRILEALMSVRIAAAAGQTPPPVLTVGVSQ